MTDRIIDLSDKPAWLSVRNDLLTISFRDAATVTGIPAQAGMNSVEPDSRLRRNDGGDDSDEMRSTKTYRSERSPDPNEHYVPISDIAVLIASHPQISYTHAVLSGLAQAGGVFVTCNAKHMPVSMLLPLVTHSLQAERFAAQSKVGVPARKRVWQQIVQAQIRSRALVLIERTGKDWGLEPMSGRVKSGDPQNLEAQAARIYWRALFGDEFLRDREEEGVNACLNYGFGVLRAIVARALCGAGLLPALGLHHHNRYDTFCLADDLMEPFRPVVERVVAALGACPAHSGERRPGNLQLDKESKRVILEGLLGRFTAHDESRTLFDWISRSASSLAALIEGHAKTLEILLLTPDS